MSEQWTTVYTPTVWLERWRVYYEAFLGDVDMSEQSTNTADRIIRHAANAADEALKQEQQRWGIPPASEVTP